MSESKATPGPWHAERSLTLRDGEYDFVIGSPEEPIIAEVFGRTEDGAIHPSSANARLIAAAPDLLAELRKQVNWLRHIRPQLAGKASGSFLDGLDQSIKYMGVVIARAESPTRSPSEE